MYGIVKLVHLATVAASFALFFVRGLWMIRASAMLSRRWVRIAPHVNDTVLLVSGIALALLLRVSPGEAPWLAAKLVALVVYIGMGMLALRPGRARRLRVVAWLAALLVFGYIVAVAVTRSPSL